MPEDKPAKVDVASSAKESEVQNDRLFSEPVSMVTDFVFDNETATVFDDMVSRSVPFYREMQRMACEIASDFAVPGTNLFDLGCATGTTLALLDRYVDPGVRFVGIDNSEEMLAKARDKLSSSGSGRSFELMCRDLHDVRIIDNASVVTMILTLQFVRPLHRVRVIESLARGINRDGCLILTEKITQPDSLLNRLFIKYYYEFKRRNGYSEIEIAQKREALENVLIPYRFEENRDLLLEAGFRQVEEVFRWYNFSCLIAVK
jgi:tRNA (cmo5U34)-methyltransferase